MTEMDDEQAFREIEAQIGRGAGNIAATNLRHHTYHTETLAGPALAVQQSLRSAWTLAEIWNNGTTVWRSPAGDQTATVTPDGEIQILSAA
jgi:hypothetical protein